MHQSFEDRARLATEIYRKSFDYFESFEGEIGTQMTYLLGAVLDDKCLELDCSNPHHHKVMEHFQKCFPVQHPVWNYIHLEF